MAMRTWLSCSIAVLSLLSSQAYGEDQLLRKRFFNEAPDHWKRIAEAVDKVECWGKAQTVRKDRAGPRANLSHYKIRKNGNSLSLEIQILDESLSPSDGRVSGVNSRYAFQLTQPKPSQPWLARLAGAKYRDHVSFEIKVGTDGIVNPYTFPFNQVSLPHMIQDPGFKCLSVDAVEREGKPAAKVTFSYTATTPEPGYPSDSITDLQGGWVILSPDDHWSIQECKLSFADSTKTSHFVEYGEMVDGYRIPRRIQSKMVRKGKQGEEITDTDTFDYERFVRIDLPEEAFSLSAYGLPESLTETGEKSGRSYLVASLFGLAALGALVSVILRRRSKSSPQ